MSESTESVSVDSRIAVVLTTLPDTEAGEALVRTLVEEHLIACGNVLPGIVSIFRWEGRVERENEVLAVLKTAAELVPSLHERITELHPYSVPEIVELEVGAVARAYRDWVLESSKVSA